jgi:hypothetical protein
MVSHLPDVANPLLVLANPLLVLANPLLVLAIHLPSGLVVFVVYVVRLTLVVVVEMLRICPTMNFIPADGVRKPGVLRRAA